MRKARRATSRAHRALLKNRVTGPVLRLFEYLIANILVQTKYVLSDSRRRPRNFIVAVLTVFLVVMFIIVLFNAIRKSPIVFVKLSEDQVGEYDMLLTPRVNLFTSASLNQTALNSTIPTAGNSTTTTNDTTPTTQQPSIQELLGLPPDSSLQFWINETYVREKTRDIDEVRGTAPRWTLLGRVYNPDDLSRNTSIIILAFDTERERDIGLGREWDKPALGAYDQCYLQGTIMRYLGLKKTEKVLLGIDLLEGDSALSAGLQQQIDEALKAQIRAVLLNTTLTFNASQVNITFILQQLGIPVVPGAPMPNGTIDIPVGEALTPAGLDALVDQIYLQLQPFINTTLSGQSLSTALTIMDDVGEPKGKWPSSLGNVVVLEKKFLTRLVQSVLPQNQVVQQALFDSLVRGNNISTNATTLSGFLAQVRIDDYALLVAIQNRHRLTYYVRTAKEMNRAFIAWTNRIAERIGVDFPADTTLPLVVALGGLYYARLFLDQIFWSVLAILMLLSMMLIYSLLLSDVEEKTYEYGMLRALGMQHDSLVMLLVLQSLYYSVPGMVLGLAAAVLLNVPTAILIGHFSATDPNYGLSGTAVALGLSLGFAVPLVANIAPIKRALSRTLRDSLDVYHQSFSETTVQMIRLENLGLSLWQSALAVVMVVAGFVVYYVIPYSFTFNNLPLFFGVLNGILIGMLLGASAVGSTAQPFAERLFLHAMLSPVSPDRNLKDLVRKNLAGHRRRNRKTALMFTTSLAFMIFAGAMFTLQATAVADNLKSVFGADVVIQAPSWDSPLDETRMRAFLQQETAKGRKRSAVAEYGFVSFALADQPSVRGTSISNLAGTPNYGMSLVGVESRYLNVVFSKYYVASELNDQFSYRKTHYSPRKSDTVLSLYADAGRARLPQERNGIVVPPDVTSTPLDYTYANGTDADDQSQAQRYAFARSNNETYVDYVDIIISEALRVAASVDVDTPLRVQLDVKLDKFSYTEIDYLAKSRAMLRKMPGFFFSSYRQTAGFTTAVVSMDQFQVLLAKVYEVQAANGNNNATTTNGNATAPLPDVPKAKVLVRLRSGVSRSERERVINGLRNFITDDTTLVYDVNAILKTTEVSVNLILVFFNIVAIIAVILCFFMLFLSFTANVRENSWEFGVLRAVGLNSWQVIRVYIYEALCIILGSITIGTIIGIIIAVTLTLQFNLFVEMPFQFQFPYALFFSVVGMSIILAAVGSYLPARSLKKKPIASALKGS